MAATVGYDLLGRRSSLGLGLGSVTSSVAYSYDGAGRLAALGRDLAGTASDQNVAFAYDPAGEIVTRTGSNDAYAFTALTPGTTAYAANGLNQMVQAGSAAPSYDSNGNMTSDGATTFAYDAENRLVSATGAKNATLAYDPLGRLWQVTGGGATTRFLYDGDRALIEYDGAGGLLRSYVHGPGADEPLVWYEAAPGGVSRRFLHADERGSIVAVADSNGAALALDRYDEYGVPAASNLGRFQYTGQKWIGELGLYDYKARMYDPGKGRFVQVDPKGYDEGPNWYAYADDDPINYIDSTGQGKVRWFVETVKGVWKEVSERVALSSRRAGKNVEVTGPGRVGKGKRLEERVQGSKGAVKMDTPHRKGDPAHRGTTEDHFQPVDRKTGGEGHTFVGPPQASVVGAIAAGLEAAGKAVGTWEDQLPPDASAGDRSKAQALDLIDPASDVADLLKTASDLVRLFEPKKD